MPASVAVPLPLSVKLTPDGSAGVLVADSAGAGNAGGGDRELARLPGGERRRPGAGDDRGVGLEFTVRVKFWVAFGLTPFAAVIVSG